jgi:spermidine synthase
MNERLMPLPRRFRAILLCLLFGASGVPGLIAQLTWTRVFAAALGHEAPALCGVVTAFFAGVAVGARLLDGPISRSVRPAWWYAGLEVFSAAWIAVGTVFLPSIQEWALGWCGPDSTASGRLLVAFLVPLVVAGPAAAAMGATLPAMDRAVAPLWADGRAVAGLYAANTGGAVLGVLVAVAWLMPWAGFRASLWIAAAIQVGCAGIAGWIGRAVATAPEPPSPPAPRPSAFARGLRADRSDGPSPAEAATAREGGRGWRGTAFVTGLLGIGFELLGVRVLAQTTENTIQTFAAVLAVFLAGTAAGAAGARWIVRRRGRISTVGLLGGLAVGVLLETLVMAGSPGLLSMLRKGAWPGWMAEGTLAAAVFLLPTMLMGAVFSEVAQGARGRGGGVGGVVAWNALGGALGGPVFLIGVLPLAGLRLAVGMVAAGYGVWALITAVRGASESRPRPGPGRGLMRREVGVAMVMFAGLAIVVGWVPFRLLELPPGSQVTRMREGFLATVAVVRTADGHRTLRVNNHFQQGGTATASAARRHAHLPLLLHPAPRRVLFLGVGTGITLGAAAAHPGLQADGVELLPEVVDALPEFEPENGAPQRRPGFRVIEGDARRYARVSTNTYDVVVADLFHPSEDGAGFLYTREHFAAVRERLAPGGIFCQWLPLHQLDRRGFADVGRTFREVFPGATLWLLRFNVDVPVVGLLGRREAGESLRVDPAALGRRLREPGLAEALRPLAWSDPRARARRAAGRCGIPRAPGGVRRGGDGRSSGGALSGGGRGLPARRAAAPAVARAGRRGAGAVRDRPGAGDRGAIRMGDAFGGFRPGAGSAPEGIGGGGGGGAADGGGMVPAEHGSERGLLGGLFPGHPRGLGLRARGSGVRPGAAAAVGTVAARGTVGGGDAEAAGGGESRDREGVKGGGGDRVRG